MSEAPIPSGLRARWDLFWHAEIDAAPLAAFRQGFAWTLLIYFLAWSLNAREWLTDQGYHPPAELDPINAPHLPLLPEAALYVVGPVFFTCLIAYIFGYARRVVI